jgi:uncharacterized protein
MSYSGDSNSWALAQAQLEGEPAPLEILTDGEERSCASGQHFVVSHHWGPEHWHGHLPLSWLINNSALASQWLQEQTGEPSCSDWSGAVFLDTETTGLRPGDETTVFLAGMGWLDDGFHLEQLMMRTPEEEPGFLDAVAARLLTARLLVTFNGRGFDVPVLAARFRLVGIPFPPLPPHLDLLTLARSRWRRRLPSCSLASLEFHLLHIEREQDVPGHLAPGLYRGYQATGDGRLLVPVLEHNAIDILSMVTLAGHMCREDIS